MASTRLPGKPLAEIDGHPILIHVRDRCIRVRIGRVVVAFCKEEVPQALSLPVARL